MSIKIKKMVRDGVATEATPNADIEALETAVGDSDSGLIKDVNTLETTIGDSDSGLVKDIADITSSIGDEETADTILYRIKALEDAATPASESEPTS